MASHFYSLQVGKFGQPDVVKGTSTNAGAPFELRIDDGASGMNKTMAYLLLQVLENYIVTDGALP